MTGFKRAQYAKLAAYSLQRDSSYTLAMHYARLAYELKPDFWTLQSLHDIKVRIHNWTGIDTNLRELMSFVRFTLAKKGTSPLDPYSALHYPFGIEELSQICSSYAQDAYKKNHKVGCACVWCVCVVAPLFFARLLYHHLQQPESVNGSFTKGTIEIHALYS
jgi:hypothetical protein